MARPTLSADARRSERIVFWVTPAERLQGETQAIAAGLSGAHLQTSVEVERKPDRSSAHAAVLNRVVMKSP